MVSLEKSGWISITISWCLHKNYCVCVAFVYFGTFLNWLCMCVKLNLLFVQLQMLYMIALNIWKSLWELQFIIIPYEQRLQLNRCLIKQLIQYKNYSKSKRFEYLQKCISEIIQTLDKMRCLTYEGI